MSPWLTFCVALVSLCAGLLAVAVWLWVTRLRTSAPGPRPVPLIGNALHFYKQPVLLDTFWELHKRYGDVVRFYVGPKLVILISQPEDVQRVLLTSKTQERDPYFTSVITKMIGYGLLTSKGEIWERHRKTLEPLFRFTELEQYLEIFNEEAHVLCEKLAAKVGAEIDLHIFLSSAALRVVLFAVGGMKWDVMEPDPRLQEEQTVEIINFLKTYSAVTFRPWNGFDGLMWMTADGRELKRLTGFFKEFTERYLTALRNKTCNVKSKIETHFNRLLLEENPERPGADDDMRNEILTLVGAGTETISNTVGYVLCLLGLHREWQEAAQRQLDQVFGTDGDFLRPATMEDVSQLSMIDAVIKEALRLFPAVPLYPRLLHEDIPLAGGRYVAPRGCCVFVSAFATHRLPELYPDPDKFDPGRFLQGGSATFRKSTSYMPFSSGSRRCLAGHFATMEMKVLLGMLLRRFTILPGSAREQLEATVFSVAGRPLTGFRVSLVPRESDSFLKKMKEQL